MANRTFEYNPTDEAIIVERILIQVHKAIDRKLPGAEEPPSRYSKTVFSDDESTAFVKIAVDHEEKHNKNKQIEQK